MSDLDLTRLPKGERGRMALLDYVRSSDDRVERYFLEVKSDVDLTTKEGRAKVAKFVLAAANRDADRAAKRFEGHALMVLGVGAGVAAGVGAFEAMDLERDVQKFTGVDGPVWDFERIPVDDDRDVIMIVVDPPTGAVWTCLADGPAGLQDGAIYVRGDGDTRRASGAEIRQMISRAQAPRVTVDVDVELLGQVQSFAIEAAPIVERVNREADRLLSHVAPRGASAAFRVLGSMDTRPRARFTQEVEAWRTSITDDPFAGPLALAAHQLDGLQIRVTNRTRTFLRDVRVEIEFDAPVRALEWLSPLEDDEEFDVLPGRPKAWGTDTIGALGGYSFGRVSSSIPVRSPDGVTKIESALPARLGLSFQDLRPETTRLSDDDDVVLVMLPVTVAVESITARWRLTAAEVHDVFEGEFEVTVKHVDVDAHALVGGNGGS
ncbi:hypothetical protein F9L07_28530 [Pimelobacter simplex]|uniref:Uncharacterized protein n=1 Tax=Nocardioides simplex TaxID=2045 RepID=A0A7J5DQN9_NOCSI|nr:hypothetical protein [Pimelobacter simplex]KAB2806982.1 hypothetical protein F9L07_28530 [Pimelobacter simplex]